MANKKDYNKMREALACYEAEQLQPKDVYELLLYGIAGYDDNTNREVEDMFVGLWGKEQIPYMEKEYFFEFRGQSLGVEETSKEGAFGYMYMMYPDVSKTELDEAYKGNSTEED